jgi:small-conductance mechanosensitive channel
VFKILRVKLQDNILSHVEIDDGIKHSLASGFGFVGVVISLVLAIMVMGGDLSSLALVAGALSVGIGFGLQNIVNNFMSGIILLFERPIKVGDWVKIDGEEGTIKQINIRSTEIETFSRSSVIIPNATLLSNSVTNMTHGNNWMRFSLKVGVAYGSDVEKVKKILLECANANRRVLKKPEPYVLFQDFGASSLDFELRGYSSNIWDGWSIPSELRFEINRRFNEEGIEIPFNQLVVHQADDDNTETKTETVVKKAKTDTKKEETKR